MIIIWEKSEAENAMRCERLSVSLQKNYLLCVICSAHNKVHSPILKYRWMMWWWYDATASGLAWVLYKNCACTNINQFFHKAHTHKSVCSSMAWYVPQNFCWHSSTFKPNFISYNPPRYQASLYMMPTQQQSSFFQSGTGVYYSIKTVCFLKGYEYIYMSI